MGKPNVFVRALSRIKKAFTSRVGVIATGTLSLLNLAMILGLLISPYYTTHHADELLGGEFVALRQKALAEGVPSYSSYAIETQYDGDTYSFGAYDLDINGHSFTLSTTYPNGEGSLEIVLDADSFTYLTYDESTQATMTVGVTFVPPTGQEYTFDDGLPVPPNAMFDMNANLELFFDERSSRLNPKEWDAAERENALVVATETATRFANNIDGVFRAFGVTDSHTILANTLIARDALYGAAICPFFAALISLIGGPLFCLFIFGWIHLLKEDKRHKLVSQGILKSQATRGFAQYDYEEQEESEPEAPPQEDRKQSGFERFVDEHHLKPVFGEWFFRGLGLFLVMLGTVLSYFANLGLSGTYGDAGLAFGAGIDYYQSIMQTGSFVLAVAIIGIIAETHRNLKYTSAFFFSLGFTFYLTVNATLLFVDYILPFSLSGITIGEAISSLLPGNLFLGIGLFAFTGFFLFDNPPKWFINRRAFRLMSLIPATIAVASIVVSALTRAGITRTGYWIRNILFIRDFDIVFVGIGYEFALYGFRSLIKQRYGEENVEKELARPATQFMKNGVLCALIVAFSLFFYLVPKDVKTLLDLPKLTFIWALIPLFVFYKPAGANHKQQLDVLYYALYILAMALPRILNAIMEVFS